MPELQISSYSVWRIAYPSTNFILSVVEWAREATDSHLIMAVASEHKPASVHSLSLPAPEACLIQHYFRYKQELFCLLIKKAHYGTSIMNNVRLVKGTLKCMKEITLNM